MPKVAEELFDKESGEMYKILYSAIDQGQHEAVRVLDRKGYDLNRQAEEKRGPLHKIAQKGVPNIIEPLIREGADPEIRARRLCTSLPN